MGKAIAIHSYKGGTGKSSIAANTDFEIRLYDGGTRIVRIIFTIDDMKYISGGLNDIKLNFMVADTFVHIKIMSGFNVIKTPAIILYYPCNISGFLVTAGWRWTIYRCLRSAFKGSFYYWKNYCTTIS